MNVHLQAWPWSGVRELFGALGEDWVLRRIPSPAPAELQRVVEELREGRRVVVASSAELPSIDGVDWAVIPPTELWLTRDEIQALARALDSPWDVDAIDRLHAATWGWYGPTRWFLERPPGPPFSDPEAPTPPWDQAFADAWARHVSQASLDAVGTLSGPAWALPAVWQWGVGHRGISAQGTGTVFELRLLGSPRVRRRDAGGERELDWRMRRALHTVLFLALAPERRATKDQLIDALWPESTPQSIRKNFHPTLSEARSTLGQAEAILFSGGVYRLSESMGWRLDVAEFQDAVDRGQRLRLEGDDAGAMDVLMQGWKAYSGPLLGDLEDRWAVERRRGVHRQYLGLLRTLGDLAVQLGDDATALDAYRALLLQEPFEERVHLALMEVYSRQGRRDLVRRQYVRMQESLLEELSVEPTREIQERYHQLML